MATKYSKHFLMTADEVKNYCVKKIRYFKNSANLNCTEIGDGNINYVFRVVDTKTGRSLVVKQADKLLRASGRPLNTLRSKIEAAALAAQGKLAPGTVPAVYCYDETMCALSMEDICTYENLRTFMLAGKTSDHFADSISSFLAETLLATTDLVLDRAQKKEWVKIFTNIELCDISEDLVFTEPYYNYKKRNIITKGNEQFVEKHLYCNEALKAQVGILRNSFMNNAQALIHGDLHSGSIFINETGIKVIDPEFAFYGPMGYDIGNVIGNLVFALAHKFFTRPYHTEFIAWAEKAIEKTGDLTATKLSQKYDELVQFPLYNAEFKKYYLANVQADTFGFAGTEIIRRTVGDTKVAEINSVTDKTMRLHMERALIATGEKLIMERTRIRSARQIVEFFNSSLKNCRAELIPTKTKRT